MTVPTKDLHGELAVTAYTVVHDFISDNVKLRYPTIIFIHGELAVTAYTVVHEFISDNVKLGHPVIIFIHGKGSGKLKKEVHEILRKDKRVKEFYLDPWNIGQTIVHLDIKKI